VKESEEFEIPIKDETPTRWDVFRSKLREFFRDFREGFTIFDFFKILASALAVIALLFTFFFRVFTVDGPSMVPALDNGDRIVTSAYGYKPERGDIVVLYAKNLNKPIVKRIIAVAGDEVDINFASGIVTVNGTEEHYTDELTRQQQNTAFPITVAEGTVFVLGDNRDMSLDSRSPLVGCVEERYIVGKVLFRVYPLGKGAVK